MLDGKSWFEEKATVCKPKRSVDLRIDRLFFPIHQLKHSYSFEKAGDQTRVKQVTEYEIWFIR
jgi:uncharacterized Ntn-hydrolase superfamily protein